MKVNLSVVIIARNEAQRISACLESVQWADDIVVVDNGSTDGTPELCRIAGARVIESEWRGFGATRNIGIAEARHEWVFSLDADERVSEELRTEICELFGRRPEHTAYQVRRVTYYLGRGMGYGSLGNDWHVRLFRRTYARYTERLVHEYVSVSSGTRGKLEGVLYHYPYQNIEQHVARVNLYTTLAAEELSAQGHRCRLITAFIRALATFCRIYLLRCGFLDRGEGLVFAVNSAHYTFLKYAKLWEYQHRR